MSLNLTAEGEMRSLITHALKDTSWLTFREVVEQVEWHFKNTHDFADDRRSPLFNTSASYRFALIPPALEQIVAVRPR